MSTVPSALRERQCPAGPCKGLVGSRREPIDEGESFSDVVDRLLRAEESGTHPLDELVGLLDDEEAERVREHSQTFRESADARTGAGEES